MTDQITQTKQELKSKLPDYLKQLGISTGEAFTCLNPDHADNHPSMMLDKHDNQHVKCFSCGAYWDVFDLIAINELGANVTTIAGQPSPDYDFKEAYNTALSTLEVYGTHLTTSADKNTNTDENKRLKANKINQQIIAISQDRLTDTDYFSKRGISLETAKRYNIGYNPNWVSPTAILKGSKPTPSPRLIIPTSNNSYIARDIRTDLDESQQQYAKMKEGSVHLFNGKAMLNNQPVFIVEGEIDALSIMETGVAEAIGLGSVSNTGLLDETISKIEQRNRQAHNGQLDGFNPTFLIAMDNDNAGATAVKRLEMIFDKHHLTHYTVNIARDYKDANEALTADREQFTATLKQTLKDPHNYLQGLLDYINIGQDTEAIPTGFKNLDDVLDGGLYEGLYGLGAISSLGKTTFILQMADNIAMDGRPVMYFALEMGRYELMTKSISRHTLINATQAGDVSTLAQTTRSILKGHWQERFNKAQLANVVKSFEQYGDYYTNVIIRDGAEKRFSADDIAHEVDSFVARTGKTPVVVVDYLQLLKPADERATDKANVTASVNTLKKIATKHHIPVITISSFNRGSYKEPAQMESFKESGDIEYSADILLALQFKGVSATFDFNKAKAQDVRQVELVVLKNRNGATGDTLNFGYYSMFNYFVDADSQHETKPTDDKPATQINPTNFKVDKPDKPAQTDFSSDYIVHDDGLVTKRG